MYLAWSYTLSETQGQLAGAKEDEMPGKNPRRKVGEKVRSSSVVPNSPVNAGF